MSCFQQCSDISDNLDWMMFHSAQFWRYYGSARRFEHVDVRQIGREGAWDGQGDGGAPSFPQLHGGGWKSMRFNRAHAVAAWPPAPLPGSSAQLQKNTFLRRTIKKVKLSRSRFSPPDALQPWQVRRLFPSLSRPQSAPLDRISSRKSQRNSAFDPTFEHHAGG